jgi:UrcA family protein
MLKSQTIAAVTILTAVLFNVGSADARPDPGDAPFRFNYSQAELHTETGARAVEGRLRTQVARYCRDRVPSEITRLGCERSVSRSALRALRERMPA